MNKISRQLLKIAKCIQAEEGILDGKIEINSGENDGVMNGKITISYKKRNLIADKLVVKDNETINKEHQEKQDQLVRKRKQEYLRANPKLVSQLLSDLAKKALNKFQCKPFEDKFAIGVNIQTFVEGYVTDVKSQKGKIILTLQIMASQENSKPGISTTLKITNSEGKQEIVDNSFMQIELKTSDGKSKLIVDKGLLKLINQSDDAKDAKILWNLKDNIESYIRGVANKYVVEIKRKLYEMNTPWIKRLFGIGQD